MRLFTILLGSIVPLAIAGRIQQSYVTTFDNIIGRTLGNKLDKVGTRDELYFKQFGLLDLGNETSRPIAPASSPTVAAFGPLTKLLHDSVFFTTRLANGGTFDLNSFYYGCINLKSGVYSGEPCVVTIAGYNSANVRVAGAKLRYYPDFFNSSMAKTTLDSSWRGIDTVRFVTRYVGGIDPAYSLTAIDSISHTYYPPA